MGFASLYPSYAPADTASHPRGLSRPSFVWSPPPQLKEGAGKTGCRLAPAVHCAMVALREAAQRHTGEAKTSGLPCAVKFLSRYGLLPLDTARPNPLIYC